MYFKYKNVQKIWSLLRYVSTMKACFPVVGEKEYKDSTLRTGQRL